MSGERLSQPIAVASSQFLSAVGNAAPVLLISWLTHDVAQVGRFSAYMLIYVLLVGAFRVSTGELVLAGRHQFRAAVAFSIRGSLALGAAGSIVGLILAILGQVTWGLPLIALSLLLPGLALFDLVRYFDIARGEPWKAAWADATWSLCSIIAMYLVLRSGTSTLWSLITAWGGPAALLGGVRAASLGRMTTSHAPSPPPWWPTNRPLILPYLGEYTLNAGIGHASLMIFLALAGESAFGEYRLAQTVFSASNFLYVSATILVIGRSQLIASTARRLTGMAVLASVPLLGLLLISLLPDHSIEFALGYYSHDLSIMFVWVAIHKVFAVGTVVGSAALKADGQAHVNLRIQQMTSPSVPVGVVVGYLAAGATGAAAGLALSSGVIATQFLRRSRQLGLLTANTAFR